MTSARRRGLCRKALAVACASAAGSLADPAAAQQASQPDAADLRGTIKVDVTGSHIRRSDVESALPVQVITREEIERSGFTTVAGLMATVSANIGAFTDALSIGVQFVPNAVPRPGLSSVNLRGIGDGSTLVLINGRRVANYAFDGGAVDVNSIPLSAIERVEILKDGASAIYGTDAIAGVVNFILRKDYRGVEATGYGGWTEHGGGDQYQAGVTAGIGDIATDRYNAFVTVNYQKDDALSGADRDFSRTGVRPDAGIVDLSRWTFPANVRAEDRRLLNPSSDTGCAPPLSSYPFNGRCGFDTFPWFDLLPAAERFSVLGRATFQLHPDVQLFAEAGYAYNKFTSSIVPTAAGDFAGEQFFYPAGGPFYPTAFAAANDLTGDLSLALRTLALGSRVNNVETRALRAVVGVEGAAAGWDYTAAVVYSENRQEDFFASGYVSSSRLADVLATGLFNPFGPSGPEGDALLSGTTVTGKYHDAKGTTWLVDGKASRDVIQLPGGAMAIALGAEARREQLDNTFPSIVDSGYVLASGGEHPSVSGSRNVQAVYAEASIPFADGFESQLALRYDHYSDFGGTVNPKVALRWQPVRELLLRASWGTGFRAPTLYDIHTPLQSSFTAAGIGDPVRCPITHETRDCAGEFPALFGGNPNLQPETSDQFNGGLVWAPTPGLSLTFDYWRIDKKNLIVGITEADTLVSGSKFATTNVIRGPIDPKYPDLPGPIQLVLLQTENYGDLRTSGFDVGFKWRAPATAFGRFTFGLDGTYVDSYSVSGIGGLAGTNNGPYAIPRWRHYASIDWNYGPWAATLAQVYQDGYNEIDARLTDFCDEFGCPMRRVGSYSVWNLQGQYTGFRSTTLTVGVNNLADRDPPWVHWPVLGFDGGYADPRGRTFYARLTYKFR